MIETFLQRVFGDQKGNAAIGLRSPDGAVNRFEFFKYPEQFDKMVSFAKKHTNEDLYYSPILYGDQKTKLKSGREIIARTPENALTTQVVYSDSDTARPDDFRLMPSIIVTTSYGRYHCYWSLVEPISAADASEISHRVTTAHAAQGSDQNGWSANKVLRIPGSMNTSHGFPEEVLVTFTGEVYYDTDISEVYSDVEVVDRPVMRVRESEIDTPDGLPEYGESLDKISPRTLELAITKVNDNQDRSKLRYKLLCSLMREPITFEEALSIAWHSPAASKWSQEDERGFAGLVAEAAKAQAEVGMEQPEGEAPFGDFEDDEPETIADGTVSMLTDDERALIADHKHFVKRYIEQAGERVPKQNKPYDAIAGWASLSMGMCLVGFIPRRNGPEPLNFYTMEIGETTTGKSQALKTQRNFTNELFGSDPGYNIGGNPSPEGLINKLQERDGKLSWFNKDEAHGALKSWQVKDYQSGLLEQLAEFYDGYVPASLRAKQEAKNAKTYFVMQLTGTPKAMIGALNRDLFLTGFLARFQWAIGEPREVTYDSMAEEDSDGEDVKLGFDPMGRQLAAEIVVARRLARKRANHKKIAVKIAPDAAKRLQEAKWYLTQNFVKDRNWEIMEPAMVRMGVTIRKAASIIALSEAREWVTYTDILIALEAAEEWVKNLIIVAAQISANDFQRECDEIEDFIKSKGGSVRKDVVMRRFKDRELRFLLPEFDSLKAQGRLREVQADQKIYMETVKEKS